MASFSSILDKPASEVERPKPLPVGTYLCVVKGLPRFDKSTKKGTDFVEFTMQIVQPYDDVDQEALEAMGGFQGKTIKSTYYITDDALWRLKKFIEDCGIDTEEGSIRQLIEQTPNCQVAVTIKHTASEDGTTVYANVGGTAQVQD